MASWILGPRSWPTPRYVVLGEVAGKAGGLDPLADEVHPLTVTAAVTDEEMHRFPTLYIP